MEKLLDEKGRIHAIDLWDEGIATLKRSIKEKGISKIKPTIADIRERIPLETESIDFCLLATILHDLSREEQDATLNEVVRILKIEGMLAIIEFKKIDHGPGPPPGIRISELAAEEKIKKYGFAKKYCG
jgi:ubiquinone/menaquinone biosynthesis C-methylase UbiE